MVLPREMTPQRITFLAFRDRDHAIGLRGASHRGRVALPSWAMPTEGSQRGLGAGFTPVERVLIFAAPVLAAALTFNYQWRNEDAEERAAESTRRERLAG